DITRRRASSDNIHPLPNPAKHLQRLLQFLWRVGFCHDGADPGFTFGNGGEGDAGAEDTFFEELAGEVHGELAFADDDGRDRSLAGRSGAAADIEAEQAKFFFPEARVLPELFHTLGFVLKNIESSNAGRGYGRRMRSRKQKRPRPMIEKIDEIARSTDVSTQHSDGFRQSSNLDIDASVYIEVIDRAAAIAAEYARGVGIVDHHNCAVFFRDIAQAGQRADVAIHRKDSIADQQLPARLILYAGELLFGVSHVFVAENENLRLRQARAIDDRCMIERIGDDEIVLTQHCRHRTRIRRKA